MERVVIADAGPLIALAGIGRLDLLHQLFGPVSVTGAVADEVLQGGRFPDGSALARAFDQGFLRREDAQEPVQCEQAQALMNLHQIDPGEAFSLVLAQQAQAQGAPALLVMDDLRGRDAAQHQRVAVVGTVGVLLLAKQHGHVAQVKPLLLAMRHNGYFLGPHLIAGALQRAGE